MGVVGEVWLRNEILFSENASHVARLRGWSGSAASGSVGIWFNLLNSQRRDELSEMVEKNTRPDYDKIVNHAGVTCVSDVLTFRQAVAVVRHGERLDSTPAWSSYPERNLWPMDPPLTEEGHIGSREVGHHLQHDLPEGSDPFEVIISSPYLRCAESACQIARVLKIPVVFDRDVGEIFGDAFRHAQSNPHRSSKELAEILVRHFPDVEYAVDADGVQMVGSQPRFPETLREARRRFQFKVAGLSVWRFF